MSAARKPPAPLQVVAHPDHTDAAPEGDDEWRSKTVIDAYSPEHQFVGSLMWLPADQARPLLNLVPDTAIWRPATRWAYELIHGLVEAGADPTPVSVLAAGRHQAARDAIDPDTPPTPNRHKQLAVYLFDAYAQAVAPPRRSQPTPAKSSTTPTGEPSTPAASGCSSWPPAAVIAAANMYAFLFSDGKAAVAALGAGFVALLAVGAGYGDASWDYPIARGQHIQLGAATIITAGSFALLYLVAYYTARRFPLRRKQSLEYRAHPRHRKSES